MIVLSIKAPTVLLKTTMYSPKTFPAMVTFWAVTNVSITATRHSGQIEQITKLTVAKLREVITGYEEDAWGSKDSPTSSSSVDAFITVQQRRESVQCGFNLAVLSFLHLSSYMLKWYGHEEWIDSAVDRISQFSSHCRRILVILYNIGFTGLFSMWLTYVYTSEVTEYLVTFRRDEVAGKELVLILADMHEKVTENVQTLLTACQENNKLNVMHPASGMQYKNLKILNITTGDAAYRLAVNMMEEYTGVVDEQMKKNEFLEVGQSNRDISPDRLYLNDVALQEESLHAFQFMYDPNIVWGNATTTLRQAYDKAKNNPMTVYDGFQRIQQYQLVFKDILKVIMLRITWTHALLINSAVDQYGYYFFDYYKLFWPRFYVKKLNDGILDALSKFVNVTGLKHDKPFMHMISAISKKAELFAVYEPSLTDIVKEQLREITVKFSGVNALDNPVDGQMLFDLNTSWTAFAETNDLCTQYKEGHVELPPNIKINNARAMLLTNHVKKILKNVHFDNMHYLFSSSRSMDSSILDTSKYYEDDQHNSPTVQND